MNHQTMLVTGDLYNRIFAVQTSNVEEVDYTIWNQIFESLPKGYLLPDLEVLSFIAHNQGV